MSRWLHILSREELDRDYALTTALDPRFARADRTFWESRTAAQLKAIQGGAWLANNADQYQKARSYLALHQQKA